MSRVGLLPVPSRGFRVTQGSRGKKASHVQSFKYDDINISRTRMDTPSSPTSNIYKNSFSSFHLNTYNLVS